MNAVQNFIQQITGLGSTLGYRSIPVGARDRALSKAALHKPGIRCKFAAIKISACLFAVELRSPASYTPHYKIRLSDLY